MRLNIKLFVPINRVPRPHNSFSIIFVVFSINMENIENQAHISVISQYGNLSLYSSFILHFNSLIYPNIALYNQLFITIVDRLIDW